MKREFKDSAEAFMYGYLYGAVILGVICIFILLAFWILG